MHKFNSIYPQCVICTLNLSGVDGIAMYGNSELDYIITSRLLKRADG